MAGWISMPTPDLSASSNTIVFLQQATQYLVAVVGVFALMMAAARMIWTQRADPMKDALAGIGRLVVVSGCGVAGITLLSQAGDAFSTWILGQAGTGTIMTMGTLSTQVIASSSLVIILSSFAILGFIVQLALLIVRSALLVVLAGLWPLSAAASMTPTGHQWFKKNVAWILAFLLFKPVAAIVYAAAIEAYVTSDSVMGVIIGLVLLMLATLTLPALMRFVVPMVSAVGNVSTAQAATAAIGAAVGAVAIVATGGAATPVVAGGALSSASSLGGSALSGPGDGGRAAGGAGPTPPAPPPSSAAGGPEGEAPGGSGGAVLAGAVTSQ
ncbi:MAG TPA: hypothetical protein VMQ59_14650, partial [Acidimicrobiales bacterium]|nr:hypothetical protein [Acidimicrobiales bacterium]